MPERFNWLRLAMYGVLAVFAVFFLLPIAVVVLNSVRGTEDINHSSVIGLPSPWIWGNFSHTWSKFCIAEHCSGIQPYFWNSLRMAIPATAISTMLGALNGYTLTLWRLPTSRWPIIPQSVPAGSGWPPNGCAIQIASTLRPPIARLPQIPTFRIV